MAISEFVLMCKDFLMLILSACNTAVSSLFSMPLFLGISLGQVLLGLICFGIIFGFVFRIIASKFGGE